MIFRVLPKIVWVFFCLSTHPVKRLRSTYPHGNRWSCQSVQQDIRLSNICTVWPPINKIMTVKFSVLAAHRGRMNELATERAVCNFFSTQVLKLVCQRLMTKTLSLSPNLHVWLLHWLCNEVAEDQGQGHVVLMSCFFKIAQDSGEVECGWTVLWLCLCLWQEI